MENLLRYGRDIDKIKKLTKHYKLLGEQQVYYRRNRIKRLYNLANGTINQEDYIDYANERDLFVAEGIELEDAGLMFYPVIPNLVNAILGDFDKRYSEFYALAVDPEHTNGILKELTGELRNLLIGQAEALFMANEPTEEQYQEFMTSDQILDFYSTEYRSTIEQWANHIIKIDEERLKMKRLQREVLKQIICTEMPFVHVNYIDGNYTVEVLNEADVFYLQSKYSSDVTEAQMIGYFEDLTIGSILNKFANLLTEEDIERIVGWADEVYGADFRINNFRQTGNVDRYRESKENYLTFSRLAERTERKYDDFQTEMARVTTMYFLLPERVGKLRYIGEGIDTTMIVSDDFKVTIKPTYNGKKKMENLLHGEHVDWFYINRLWRSIEIDVRHSKTRHSTENTDQSTAYVLLEEHPIQYSDINMRYGVRIPIHGGPTTNLYSDPVSTVEKAAPWQIMCNWLGNRMQQLLSTEVGKFIIINQNMIPQESYDGAWGKNNLLKWFMVAHDTSIAPADPSITNMGQNSAQISGGFGQIVDLTKTQEILEKAQLFNAVKNEAFAQFGFTAATLYGDVSPTQTGASIAQQMQRSLTQIQGFYTRLDEIMRSVWDTVLETAQYVAASESNVSLSYMSNDKARVIFNTNTDGFLLHKLATYSKSSAADMHTLETIKQAAISTNTMGADSLELAEMITAKSTPEILNKLNVLSEKKLREREREGQMQQQQQQQLLEQQHQQRMAELAELEKQADKKFEQDVILAQIRATGFGNSSASEVAKEVKMLAEQDLNERKFESMLDYRDMLNQQKQDQNSSKQANQETDRELKEKIEMTKLELRRKEIDAANQRTKTMD